ncbi:uncharacterized protein LOC133850325 isoform X2 [Drosophila sulfurigaster albostrigata]|uniref:uncharacterized protein LOC133850325 isoform X2 n=1 Tax=Drosophila sulfurigaster albostrigata TaxID=89887 RepID=UPI002D219EEC|nr:uncharacterized protein LOC133850325 isoform X2 [Drosophila sulfurigaster albostrigata]
MEKRNERKHELPCKAMLNFLLRSELEAESSLNPLASEFVPSYLKPEIPNLNLNSNQKMKSEATSTTSLGHSEIVGDASYLHAQRQLFELLHQLGNKMMPLKAINVSLTPDGHGINMQFLGERGTLSKQMFNEKLCQNASLHLEMDERSCMPRRLPNVLAANFMARMGDVLNDKMAWSDQADDTNSSSTTTTINSINSDAIKPENLQGNLIKSFAIPISQATDIWKCDKLIASPSGSYVVSKKQLEPSTIKITGSAAELKRSKPSLISKAPSPSGVKLNNRSEIRQRPGIAKLDLQYEKKSIKGTPTPRKSMGQPIKKGPQKLAPRGTYTSQIRQTEAQKRLGLLKVEK